MSKNYSISKETVSDGNLLTDLVFAASMTTMDFSSKREVTVVRDNNTGDKYTFSSSRDAEKFIKGR